MQDDAFNSLNLVGDDYDLFYSWKDYAGEATQVKEIIEKYKLSNGNSLLDFACGTGKHLNYLKRNFEVLGTDISEGQLKTAKANFPDIIFDHGDMRTFDAKRKFDIVTCLYSSIGYMYPLTEMEKAVANMANHLKPGGVIIIEPWKIPTSYLPDGKVERHREYKGYTIESVNIIQVENDYSITTMDIKIAEPNNQQKRYLEKYKLALFSREQYTRALENCNLAVNYDEEGLMGRGLYIGVKPL